MDISVIIPTFNRAHTLARAIDSVLAQNFSAQEIIVVDDASEDETTNLLKQYSKIRVIRLEHNQGVSVARNKGISVARSSWIAFLDSDDAWMPNKLSKQVAMSETALGNLIFHTEEKWIRNGRRVNAMKKHAKPDGWVYQRSLALCCVSPSSILVHRKVFDDCGLFDESLPACEDYDLWLRIFSRYPVKLIYEPLVVKYGGHADQLSRQYWGMDRFRVIALRKMLEANNLDEKDRRLTLEMLQKKCLVLINGALKRGKQENANFYQNIIDQYSVPKTST